MTNFDFLLSTPAFAPFAGAVVAAARVFAIAPPTRALHDHQP
jgi:hypothetical protein